VSDERSLSPVLAVKYIHARVPGLTTHRSAGTLNFLFWRRKSRATAPAHRPPIAPETIVLIREMAAANRAWGAERIRGELLKLQIRVATWAIQKYLRDARQPRRFGRSWATFLHNHAHSI
jgi:putative transposase